MFDKQLCELIHKKEITVNDIASFTFAGIIYCAIILLVLAVTGDMTNALLHEYTIHTPLPFSPSDISCFSYGVFGAFEYALLGALAVVTLFAVAAGICALHETVGRIKIAKCPNYKEETEE